jgi:hypothetical protein
MRGRVVAGALLVLVGLVWIGQGFGLLRGSSFMVDDVRWAVAGIGAVGVGAALVVSARRSRSDRRP